MIINWLINKSPGKSSTERYCHFRSTTRRKTPESREKVRRTAAGTARLSSLKSTKAEHVTTNNAPCVEVIPVTCYD